MFCHLPYIPTLQTSTSTLTPKEPAAKSSLTSKSAATSTAPAATHMNEKFQNEAKNDIPREISKEAHSTRSDDETFITNNNPEAPAKRPSDQILNQKLAVLELDLKQTKAIVTTEKAAKRKLYSSLVKLATELKRMRVEHRPLADAAEFANQTWYKGGMWRAPKVLPGVNKGSKTVVQKAIGLSELFFDLVVVTAFSRVGMAIAESKKVEMHDLFYFAIFWMIWSKETSYSTRFDVTDLSVQMVTLLTCFATLFASFSTNASVNSVDGTRIMLAAAFVTLLHCFLHVRVAFWYKGAVVGSVDYHVQRYAIFIVVMTLLEATTWAIGIFILPEDYTYRWAIVLGAIIMSIRLPRAFLSNDFHGQ